MKGYWNRFFKHKDATTVCFWSSVFLGCLRWWVISPMGNPPILESIGNMYDWLVVWNMFYFPFHIWDNPSHWRTHIFQDGYCTTNQPQVCIFPRCGTRWRTTRCWTAVPAMAHSIAGWKWWLPLVLNGRCGWLVLFAFYVIFEGTISKMSVKKSTRSNWLW